MVHNNCLFQKTRMFALIPAVVGAAGVLVAASVLGYSVCALSPHSLRVICKNVAFVGNDDEGSPLTSPCTSKVVTLNNSTVLAEHGTSNEGDQPQTSESASSSFAA